MSRAAGALQDREVVELLADEPALLAIADAVALTQPRPRGRRHWPRLAGAAALVLVVAAVVALFPQRGQHGGLLEDALAAMGQGPVVHARIEARLPGTRVVNLATGRAEPQLISLEYWFDEQRGRLATVVRRGGLPVERLLATPSGTASGGGYLRTKGSSAPALDPALAGFVTGYLDSLESGTARVLGSGKLGSRQVVWLQLGSGRIRERVAVDAERLIPISIVPLNGRGNPSTVSWRVTVIESVARVEANFARPKARAAVPYRGDVRSSRLLSSRQANKAVRWHALWLGESWKKLRLSRLELQTLSRGYPPGSDEPSTRGHGLQLRYTAGPGSRFVEISQAPYPEPAYAYTGGEATFNGNPIPQRGLVEIVELAPAPGSVSRVVGQLRLDGVYVTIWASSRALCLAAARALTRIPA